MNHKLSYTELSCCGKEMYFAGANTSGGFSGQYSEIANEKHLDRLYIIKGGAGCGKSTLMRSLAAEAENRGIPVTYYLCGSDPASLDCVILDGRVGVLDGTAPHVWEMAYPGAVSELIDVSAFCDSSVLKSEREEIIRHSVEKKKAYDSCYRMLAASGEVGREKNRMTADLFMMEKADAFIHRFIDKLGKHPKTKGVTVRRYTGALTREGGVRLSTLWERAAVQYCVRDFFDSGKMLLSRMETLLSEYGYDTVVGMRTDGTPSEIFIPQRKTAVIMSTDNDGPCINMERFVNREGASEVRGRFKLAEKIIEECLMDAVGYLKMAADHHFALEKIYKTSMDFAALDLSMEGVKREILGILR